jgi:hypothetical protein
MSSALPIGFFSSCTSNHVEFCSSFTSDFIGFCSNSTFDANNLVWSTYGCDICVDYVGSGQLFIHFSFISKNVCEFLELDVFICSLNVFGQYFDPY